MKPERLRELNEQTQEAQRSLAAGEHAPRERAFRAVLIASVPALVSGVGAIGFGGELLFEALRPQSDTSLSLFREIFGAHGQAAGMALALALIVAGLGLLIGAGICLAASVMEHLWVGRALRWSLVPAGALLLCAAIGMLVLYRAGYHAKRLPFGLMAWLALVAIPTGAFMGVALLYIPSFRRGE